MTGPLQEFPPLPPTVEAALRASIERFGVLVAVVKDQHGRVIDGHHRARLAAEMHVDYRVDRVTVADDDEARAMARTLNADRRHLTEQQRKEVVALLAAETVAAGPGGREEVARHSPKAIAGALGVSLDTVQRDMDQLTDAGKLVRPPKTLGQDGKVRPTKREPPATAPGRKNRMPLVKAFDRATGDLLRAVERVERLTHDDRFAYNADQVAGLVRHDLVRALELLSKAVERVPNPLHKGE